MKQKRRQKMARKALAKLPAGTVITHIARGRENNRWRTTNTVVASLFGVIFVLGFLAGRIMIPGFLLIILFVDGLHPARAVARTSIGTAVLKIGGFTGMPKKLLAIVPDQAVNMHTGTNDIIVTLDKDWVIVGGTEKQALLDDQALLQPVLV